MSSKIENISYHKLERDYLRALMTLQEPEMTVCQIDTAMESVSCGITIKHNGVNAGVAYLSSGGGKIFLDGYKDCRARVGIKASIDAGKALCELAKEAGYEYIFCVFRESRRDIVRLVEFIGFTKVSTIRSELVYEMCLKGRIWHGR